MTYLVERAVAQIDIGKALPVLCPMCGGDYNHPIRTFTATGEDEYHFTSVVETDREGETRFHDKVVKTPTRSRGGDVVQIFECEDGHRWSRTTLFHKGNTWTQDNYLEPVEP